MKKLSRFSTLTIILLFCHFSFLTAQQVINVNDSSKQLGLNSFGVEKSELFKDAERYREFSFNPRLRTISKQNVGDIIALDLFADKQYKATIQSVFASVTGELNITAKLIGEDFAYSYFSISSLGLSVAIELPLKDESYYIAKLGSKTYLSEFKSSEIQKQSIPSSGPITDIPQQHPDSIMLDSVMVPTLLKAANKQISASSRNIPLPCKPNDLDAGVTINLIIAYTDAAEQWALSDNKATDINHLISIAVDKANLVLANSLTGVTFNVVHKYKTSYQETDTSDDLYRFRQKGDGYADEVHTLREKHQADLAILIAKIEYTGGAAFPIGGDDGDPIWSAFSIMRVQQIGWTYTLVHELGHNMGAGHHWGQSKQPGPTRFSYSSGWRGITNAGDKISTVMTYEGAQYFPDGQYHPNIPYFSNPSIMYGGVVIGDPIKSDNALTLKQTKHVISQYGGVFIQPDYGIKRYKESDPNIGYSVYSGKLKDGDHAVVMREAGEELGDYATSARIYRGNVDVTCDYEKQHMMTSVFKIVEAILHVSTYSAEKIYGNPDPEVRYITYPNDMEGSIGGKIAREPGEDVGAYLWQAGTINSLNLNYKINFTNYGDKLTIKKRPILIKAKDATKEVGDADPEFEYEIVGGSLVSGDVFSGKLTRVVGEVKGTYNIEIGTLSLGNNYDLQYESGAKLTINNAPVAIITIKIYPQNVEKTYGDADPMLTYKCDPENLKDKVTGVLSRVSGETVGTYKIGLGSLATASSDYKISFISTDESLKINQRFIAVKADNVSKNIAASDPILTYSITSGSLVGSDLFSGSLVRVAGEAAGKYDILQGTLALTDDYALSFEKGEFSIINNVVTIKVYPKDYAKTYGEADPVFDFTCDPVNLKNKLEGKLSRAAGETVGNYLMEQGSLTATDANYDISFITNNKALTINQRPITVKADDLEKEVGQNDPELTYSFTTGSLVNGDILTGSLVRNGGETVGIYNVLQGTLAATINYNLTFQKGQLKIVNGADLSLQLLINGNNHDLDQDVRYVVPQDFIGGSITLRAITDANVQTVGLPASWDVSKPTVDVINFTTVSSTGKLKEYLLEIEKKFDFKDLVVMRWNNTLTVINNKEEHGFNFSAYQWYKNGSLILGATDQAYSVEKEGKILDKNAEYSVDVVDLDRDITLRCWESKVELNSKYNAVKIYPNPVEASGVVYLDATASGATFEGAKVELYTINGFSVKTQVVTDVITPITMPMASGIYLMRVVDKNSLIKVFKVIVK